MTHTIKGNLYNYGDDENSFVIYCTSTLKGLRGVSSIRTNKICLKGIFSAKQRDRLRAGKVVNKYHVTIRGIKRVTRYYRDMPGRTD